MMKTPALGRSEAAARKCTSHGSPPPHVCPAAEGPKTMLHLQNGEVIDPQK
jgi:hypothetical protein